MKHIKDEVSLEGKIEKITMMEFRGSPGEVLKQAELGKVFLITYCGKVVGVLSKPPGTTLTMTVNSEGKIDYTL